jgi:Lysozyme like domain
MINFMYNKRKIIGTLSIMALFGVWSNAANASENRLDSKTIVLEENIEATQVAKSVSEAKKDQLEKYQNATSLSDKDLKNLLSLVGFKGQNLKEAWAVAKKESNGRPFAFNGNLKTGDSSYGLFQINMLGMLGPDRRNKYDLDHNVDLFNPVVNAEIAFQMSNGGENWSAWKGITSKTLEWMAKFPH